MREHSQAAPERLVVGRVVRPHGLRGEVLVQILSDAPDRLAAGARIAAGDPDTGPLRELTVADARLAQGRQLLRFEGLDDRDQVEGLRGTLLSIPFSAARELGEDEYWPHQLVGLAVIDAEGVQRGTVTEVVPGSAHDLLAVALDTGGTVLVPAVAALVEIDLGARRVTVAPVAGLLGEV
jgi:16S rRNA processing protein RimM